MIFKHKNPYNPSKLREILERIDVFLLKNSVPKHLSKNFIDLSDSKRLELKESLLDNYFKRNEEYLKLDIAKAEVSANLDDRLFANRLTFIPWLDSMIPLKNSKVLDIGCGTGCSTVAFAEQGAKTIGIEIDTGASQVAKDRCKLHNLDVEIINRNASELNNIFPNNDKFNIIIFVAVMEHMTLDEKITSLRQAWDLLDKNGLLCIIQTPNRLWYKDEHTTGLPFFNWLPDDLAVLYSKNSPRPTINNKFDAINQKSILDITRLGRSFSFHELEIAFPNFNELKIAGCLNQYLISKSPLRYIKWKLIDSKYSKLLNSYSPKTSPAFFHQAIQIAIRKL